MKAGKVITILTVVAALVVGATPSANGQAGRTDVGQGSAVLKPCPKGYHHKFGPKGGPCVRNKIKPKPPAKSPPPPPAVGTISNPMPVGQTMWISFGSGEKWDATVIGYTPDATAQVLAVPGVHNSAPRPGNQYVMVAYQFTLTAGVASVDRWDIADHVFTYFKVVWTIGRRSLLEGHSYPNHPA